MWLLLSFVLAIGINLLGWAVSLALETDKFYDLTGALTFVVLNALALAFAEPAARADTRSLLAALTLVVWATRLGAFLFARVLQHSDRRLSKYLKDPISFLVIFMAQAAWASLSSLPALSLLSLPGAGPPFGSVFDLCALGACWVSAALCALADEQKRAFRADPRNRAAFITTGLWAWSRHPNYFFQITFAWSLALFCCPRLFAAAGVLGGAAAALGPLFETLLLLKVSGIPLLEAAANYKWGEDPRYRRYKENTSLLVPFPPRAARR